MEIKINREDPIPLYYQLKEQIKKEIINKNFVAGTKILPEKEIMTRYNLSYQTVTRAFRELVHENFLERIQGKGTFVTDRKKDLLTIGLVIPHLYLNNVGSINFFGAIIDFVEDEGKKNGVNSLLCIDNDNIEIEERNLKSLLDRKVDGIILYYIGEDKNIKVLKEIQASGIPLVLIDRYVEDIETDYVIVDNQRGAYEATKFLLDKGFKQIFHITTSEKWNTIKERADGFKNAIAEYKIQFDDSMIKKTNFISPIDIEKDIYNIMKDMLEKINPPFGIFTLNVPVLIGVYRAIEENRIRYDDFGLACFDELPINIPEKIPFVEVIEPLEEVSRKSVQIILDKLKGKKEIQRIVLPSTIKIVNEGIVNY